VGHPPQLYVFAAAASFATVAAAFGLFQFQQAGQLSDRLSKVEGDLAERDVQIAGLDSQVSELVDKNSELESDVAYWQEQHDARSQEYESLGAEYDSLSEQYDQLQQGYGSLQDQNQRLVDENASLISGQSLLQLAAEKERTQRESVEAQLATAAKPPYTVVQGREIKWAFKDSKGNSYNWEMPIDVYRDLIELQEPNAKLRLQKDDGSTVIVRDHTKFVDSKSFDKVIDEVYENADSDRQFLHELWFITSQLTTYSTDIGEDPRWALETFTEAGGDCEDLVILIASMLKASEHTKDWTIQMVYFDADDPSSRRDVDHVALYVKTDEFATFVESTDKKDGLGYWSGSISGWYFNL
jgi:hypothetical protein